MTIKNTKILFLFSSGHFESANNKKWFKLFFRKEDSSVSVIIQEIDNKVTEQFRNDYGEYFSKYLFPSTRKFLKFSPLKRLKFLKNTAQWIESIQPDIIHIHGVYFTYMIMTLFFLKRRPILIYSVWGSDYNISYHKRLRVRFLIKWLFNL